MSTHVEEHQAHPNMGPPPAATFEAVCPRCYFKSDAAAGAAILQSGMSTFIDLLVECHFSPDIDPLLLYAGIR